MPGTISDHVDYVSGRTRLFGIVGDPIEQVRSPEMITAEMVGRGKDGRWRGEIFDGPGCVTALPRELIVLDAIVMPERTPLIALAERCSCTAVFGREMMRGQIAQMVDFFVSA